MRSIRLFVVAAAVATSACASAGTSGPDAVARLERARTENPKSEAVLRSLGIAYYKANRLADARAVLDQAAALDPKDGTAALYLGLTAEQQNDLPAARAAYSSYLKFGRTKKVRGELQSRLAALSRKELLLAAQTAVKQESQLGATPGSPNTVAVLPMTFTGADTSLKPLERGMADLLTTDLSRSSKLVVVERARIQALLDEVKLQQAGQTDASTNVRTGRILQAGRLVQGSMVQQGQQLRVDAAVVDVPTTRITASANDDRALDQLFTLEKNIALSLLQQMGVVLTTAERNAIEQRPTRSLAAFLAYSQGLTAEDAGRFDEARRLYDQAVRLDPGFIKAQDHSRQAQAVQTGTQVTTQTVEAGLKGTAEGAAVTAAAGGVVANPGGSGVGGTVQTTANDLNPPVAGNATGGASGGTSPDQRDKNGAAAGTGNDNPGNKTAKITIVIHQPTP